MPREKSRDRQPVRVFNTYAKFQLMLLALGLVWLALGGMHWEPDLVGTAVMGAVVWAAREWAGGWGDSYGKTATLWLVGGVLATIIAFALSDGTSSKWFSKVSLIGAISIGFGTGALIASIVSNVRKGRSD